MTPTTRGLTEVDFLGDAEPWKLEWTSTGRGHDWLFVFGDTSAGPALAFRQVPVGAGVEAMAGVTGTFVPTYQGLSAVDFAAPRAGDGDDLLSVRRPRTAALLPRAERHLSPVSRAGRTQSAV